MPDLPTCIYCSKPVDIVGGTQEYVIPNKDQGVSKDQWKYAHLDCHKERGQDNGIGTYSEC